MIVTRLFIIPLLGRYTTPMPCSFGERTRIISLALAQNGGTRRAVRCDVSGIRELVVPESLTT